MLAKPSKKRPSQSLRIGRSSSREYQTDPEKQAENSVFEFFNRIGQKRPVAVATNPPYRWQLRLVSRHYNCTDLVACSAKGDVGLVRVYCPLRIANVILSQPASMMNLAPASGPAASINLGRTGSPLTAHCEWGPKTYATGPSGARVRVSIVYTQSP